MAIANVGNNEWRKKIEMLQRKRGRGITSDYGGRGKRQKLGEMAGGGGDELHCTANMCRDSRMALSGLMIAAASGARLFLPAASQSVADVPDEKDAKVTGPDCQHVQPSQELVRRVQGRKSASRALPRVRVGLEPTDDQWESRVRAGMKEGGEERKKPVIFDGH